MKGYVAMLAAIGAAIVLSPAAHAIVEDYVFEPATAIPDNNAAGLTDTRNINYNTAITSITKITIDLKISRVSGGWNGDLYVKLTHGSGYAILMNRVGKSTSSSVGYSDDGVDIILDDAEPDTRDVHFYRTVTGTLATGVPLTGNWQSDGRDLDPTAAGSLFSSDLRLKRLNGLLGMDAHGDWSLFVSDRAAGDTHRLDRWSMHIEGVPEPGTVAAMITGLGGLLALGRRRK